MFSFCFVFIFYFNFFSKLRNYIVNWNTTTRKPGKHLSMKYGTNEQLFWLYYVSAAVYTVISCPVVLYVTRKGLPDFLVIVI